MLSIQVDLTSFILW